MYSIVYTIARYVIYYIFFLYITLIHKKQRDINKYNFFLQAWLEVVVES